MYSLIQSGWASMFELEEYYTLDEALKLYAFFRMQKDIEVAQAKEMERRSR